MGDPSGPEVLGLNRARALWTVDEAAYNTYGQRGLELARRHMDLLRETLQGHSVSLMVFVYPWPDQVYRHDLDSRQVVFWRAWANKHGVRFVDLFPYFIRGGDPVANIREAFTVRGGDPAAGIREAFIPFDVHWNARGHQIVANGLWQELAAALDLDRSPSH